MSQQKVLSDCLTKCKGDPGRRYYVRCIYRGAVAATPVCHPLLGCRRKTLTKDAQQATGSGFTTHRRRRKQWRLAFRQTLLGTDSLPAIHLLSIHLCCRLCRTPRKGVGGPLLRSDRLADASYWRSPNTQIMADCRLQRQTGTPHRLCVAVPTCHVDGCPLSKDWLRTAKNFNVGIRKIVGQVPPQGRAFSINPLSVVRRLGT